MIEDIQDRLEVLVAIAAEVSQYVAALKKAGLSADEARWIGSDYATALYRAHDLYP